MGKEKFRLSSPCCPRGLERRTVRSQVRVRPVRLARYSNPLRDGKCRHFLVTVHVDCRWPSFPLLSLLCLRCLATRPSTAIMDLDTSSTAPERADVKYESEGEEDVLADYFEKSASVVRHTFTRCVFSWGNHCLPFDLVSSSPPLPGIPSPASSRTLPAPSSIIS